jgi:hypothetical protein
MSIWSRLFGARVLILGIFIFLAAGVSFSAGYLTARQNGGHSPIVIEKCSDQ